MLLGRRTVALGLTGAFITGVGCARPPMPASAKSPLLGTPLPKVDRRAIDGRKVDSHAGDHGSVVVKFFAQYCEPCKRTLPAAQALAADRPDVLVIGIAEDEDESVVRQLVATYGLTFPVIHDRGRVLSGRFRVVDIPMSFVAGPDRQLRWVGGPGQRPSDLEQAVDALSQ
jgi:thiol-disulfide isomerase/thioredoxin